MKYVLCLAALLGASPAFAQSPLPVIRATSPRVAIRDGDHLDKNAWTLAPKTRPDVYTADRTRQAKWVTFYTDLDSIRLRVKPGTRHNFVVLLNCRDSCYTQVASAIPPASRSKKVVARPDTIPFVLTAFNAIQVRAILNDTDTLRLHFDTGSFDFRLTKDAIRQKTHLLAGQPAALAGTAAPNYNQLAPTFKMQLGTLVWHNPELMPTTLTAQEMDGRFGYNLFEGKQVEIDYDHSRLIIYSQLPKVRPGYAKVKLKFIRSFVCIEAGFAIENQRYTGDFLLDTGSSQALIVDSAWASKQHFPAHLRVLKKLTLNDPRGKKYETSIVLAPAFRLSRFRLANVPTNRLGSKNPTGFEINYLGNDVLKRFNLLLDFEHDYLYLKPSKLLNTSYRDNS